MTTNTLTCAEDGCTNAVDVCLKYEGPLWWAPVTANFILTFRMCRTCANRYLTSDNYKLINKEEYEVIKVMNL
jgi:hypothetical protein